MRITIQQAVLASALGTVGRAADDKSVVPVLNGVLFEAQGDTLTLRATNMDVTIETSVKCDAHVAGSIVIPGKAVTNLVKRLPAGPIVIDVDYSNRRAAVTTPSGKYNLPCLDADMFPQKSDLENGASVTIKQNSLRELIRTTLFAKSEDQSKAWLTGLYLTLDGNELKGAATDGTRIAYAVHHAENTAEASYKAILSAKGLAEAVGILSDEGEATLTVTNNQAGIKAGVTQVTMRLLEGQFPDLGRLLPTDYPVSLDIPRTEFIKSLERLVLISEDAAVTFNLRPNLLELTARSKDGSGDGQESIPAKDHRGEELRIGFNAKLLLDYLKAVDAEEVRLECVETRKPAKFTPLGNPNSNYVVLPLISY